MVEKRPERTCVICRKRMPKYDLVRLVLSGQELKLDTKQNMPGRGAYLHCSWECWSKVGWAVASKKAPGLQKLERALKSSEGKMSATSIEAVGEEIRKRLSVDDEKSGSRNKSAKLGQRNRIKL